MGGINFGEFKNNFFKAMQNAANAESVDGIINTEKEEAQAKSAYISFRTEAAGMTAPVDSFEKNIAVNDVDNNAYKPEKATGEATVEDLMAFLDDFVDMAKVEEYNKKPVETLNPAITTPIESRKMAAMAEGLDFNKLNAYLDMGYQSGTAERMNLDFNNEKDHALAYMIGASYDFS